MEHMSKRKAAGLALSVIILLYIGTTLGYNLADQPAPQTKAQATAQAVPKQAEVSDISIHELWTLTNKERAKAGVPALVLDERLNKSATDKCEDMVKRDYFEHITPDGQEPWVFIKKYTDYVKAGENQAQNYFDEKEVTQAWMDSPLHKDNLLDPAYDNIGFGICKDEYPYIVQHFTGL